ncbi:MAG: hypothetical protein JXA68_00165 [Ignavibacteriales bacterium]|nr:hypothetical protein [Ignavibacteriales bacterium]
MQRRKRQQKMTKELTNFVGILLPKELDNILRVQAVLQDTSFSALLRDILQKHAKERDWNSDGLIKKSAIYFSSEWNVRFSDTITFNEYLQRTKYTLEKKYKLPKHLVDNIIQECKEQQKLNQ